METVYFDELIETLKERFEINPDRHEGVKWEDVQAKLEANPDKLRSLYDMEQTGGEPDVVSFDDKTGEITFCDCSPQSPPGRRSLCYDRPALDARKKNKPRGSAMEMADAMGIDMLTEEQYRAIQEIVQFDTKTSSWVKTPSDVRELGGAIFCDRRYDKVWVYHNGADSYYSSRGFRGLLKI